MSELAPRQEILLRAIIVEYVAVAEPVGSELLVQKYDLGVKSATVRNELAEMSELGYLEQPHTSSGRIPSDHGYRYFVDNLIVRQDPRLLDKQSLSGAAEEGEVLHRMLHDTAAALSRLTHQFTAATVVRDARVAVKNAFVSALGPQQALLVLVLSNGHVESRVVECPVGLTLEEVGSANESLAQSMAGKTLQGLQRAKLPTSAGSNSLEKFHASLAASVKAIVKELTRGHLLTEGEEFLFGQPEFKRDADRLAEALDSLKRSDALYDALTSGPDQTGTVTIGKENRAEHMHKFSVVKQRFFVGPHETGTIAVIGPTRMPYESSIPLVDFTAKALSDALTRYFG